TLPLFNCPSRRTGGPYPNSWNNGGPASFFDCANPVPKLARGDYAACVGNLEVDEFFAGPPTLEAGDTGNFTYNGKPGWPPTDALTGVIYQRSMTKLKDITRGASNTYLVGEKYLNPTNYFTGQDPADNESMYSGFDNDNFRDSFDLPIQ